MPCFDASAGAPVAPACFFASAKSPCYPCARSKNGRARARRAQKHLDSPENACASYCRSPSPSRSPPHRRVRAQTPDGDTVFAQHCAICHEHPTPENKAPPRDVLATLGPDAIFASLTEGNMRIQGQAAHVRRTPDGRGARRWPTAHGRDCRRRERSDRAVHRRAARPAQRDIGVERLGPRRAQRALPNQRRGDHRGERREPQAQVGVRRTERDAVALAAGRGRRTPIHGEPKRDGLCARPGEGLHVLVVQGPSGRAHRDFGRNARPERQRRGRRASRVLLRCTGARVRGRLQDRPAALGHEDR